VGSALGANQVNVSHFQFARNKETGEGLLFLNTDSRADDATLETLKALDSVEKVRRLAI
jgi:hypothetical protein